jgi:hypothetical protein
VVGFTRHRGPLVGHDTAARKPKGEDSTPDCGADGGSTSRPTRRWRARRTPRYARVRGLAHLLREHGDFAEAYRLKLAFEDACPPAGTCA